MSSKYLVAIFGGAVSGAEAAHQLALKGIPSVVFDQNALPYGKIEDGLPKWHAKLRDKEENAINEKLSHPLVEYVPGARLGDNVDFEDVVNNWGFSAVFVAIGAWKDRPLAIDGIDRYVGKGLIYQNPFIYWFNHKHEPDFAYKDAYDIKEGALVVGGGLASLDVVKVLMIESVQQALAERGHEVTMFDLDRSIAKVLAELGLSLDALGVKPCKLFYRRRVKDMPLSPLPDDTPELLARAEAVREKILGNYQSKYLFEMHQNRVPTGMVIENDQLAGLVMQETDVVDGRVKTLPGTEYEVRGPYVISSIGSIPEPIPGIPQDGATYTIAEDKCCRIAGFSNVYALGNAVTGRGNIKESMKHGEMVAQRIMALTDDPVGKGLEEHFEGMRTGVSGAIDGLEPRVMQAADTSSIYSRIRKMQQEQGYDGDFMKWVSKHLPTRLEELVGGH